MRAELFRLPRFRGQSSVNGPHVENFRVALRPCIVNRDTLEAPFLAVAHQLAVITVHQERVLQSATRTFPRHEMLRHHIRMQCGRIAADFDLEIARGVTGVEWTEKRKKSIHDGLAAGQLWEVDPDLPAGRPEIENAVFRKRRRKRICISMVETESVAMHGIRNLIPVAGILC